MAKLFKAQPLAGEPKLKNNILKRLGGDLKKTLHKAKKSSLFRKLHSNGGETTQHEAQDHVEQSNTQLHLTSESNEAQNDLATQTQAPKPSDGSLKIRGHGQDEDRVEATVEDTKIITGLKSWTSKRALRHESTESLLFVPRALRNASLKPQTLEKGSAALSKNIYPSEMNDEDTDLEGGVSVGLFTESVQKSSSLGSGIPPNATLNEDGGGSADSYGQKFGSTRGERDGNGPSTPTNPMFSSPASGDIANSTPSLNLSKRKKCRSAPLPFDHERSFTGNTLINSIYSETPTRLPQLTRFLPVPLPNTISTEDGLIRRPRAPTLLFQDKKSFGLGTFVGEDEINSRIQDAVSKVRNDLERDIAERLAEAQSAAKEAITKEWTATVDAMDYNHRNELEEAKEEHQIAVNDLKEKHHLKLKRAEARHGRQVTDLRDELQNLKSTVDSDKTTLQELTASKLGLAGRLASCEHELGVALNHIQTMEAQIRQEKQQGALVLRHPPGLAGYNAGGVEWQAAMTWGELQAKRDLAAVEEQLEICQGQFQIYFYKTGELLAAMAADPGKTAHVDGLLLLQEELCNELRQQSIKYLDAWDQEKRERRLEQATFSDAIDLAAMASREVNNHTRYLEISRDGLLKQIEELLQQCKRGITLNEFDRAFADHHEVVKKDNKELGIKVHSLEIKLEEMHGELNRLRAIDRQAEAAVPDHSNELRQLQEEIVRLTKDNETLQIELDIARQDQEKREPETWREVREKILREKDDEIAALRLQIDLDGGQDAASADGLLATENQESADASGPAEEEEVPGVKNNSIWNYKRENGRIFRDV